MLYHPSHHILGYGNICYKKKKKTLHVTLTMVLWQHVTFTAILAGKSICMFTYTQTDMVRSVNYIVL